MTVWIVEVGDYGDNGSYVDSVWSTEAKAEQRKIERGEANPVFVLGPIEVDKP